MASGLYPNQFSQTDSEQERGRDHTILCRRSNLNFSVFAFSYSPFSKCRWSGLSRESVGGSFSFTIVKKLYHLGLDRKLWIAEYLYTDYNYTNTWSSGVSSFNVIAKEDRLYRVGLGEGLFFSQSMEAPCNWSALLTLEVSKLLQYILSSHFPIKKEAFFPSLSSTKPCTCGNEGVCKEWTEIHQKQLCIHKFKQGKAAALRLNRLNLIRTRMNKFHQIYTRFMK